MSSDQHYADALRIPKSTSTVNVSIIDTTLRFDNLSPSWFMEPPIKGFDNMKCPSYSFLVESSHSKRKVLWDLGMRKDWNNLAPTMRDRIIQGGAELTIERNVADILREGGVELTDIEAIIWR